MQWKIAIIALNMTVTQKYFVNSWKGKTIAMIIKIKTFRKIIDKTTNV